MLAVWRSSRSRLGLAIMLAWFFSARAFKETSRAFNMPLWALKFAVLSFAWMLKADGLRVLAKRSERDKSSSCLAVSVRSKI